MLEHTLNRFRTKAVQDALRRFVDALQSGQGVQKLYEEGVAKAERAVIQEIINEYRAWRSPAKKTP